jgi:hypothetical protein
MLRKITRLFLALALSAAFTGAHAAIIFDNYNGFSIINQHGSGGIGAGTASDTMFTLSADTFVGELRTYQFGETSFPSTTYSLTGPGSFSVNLTADYIAGTAPYVNYHAFLNQLLAAGTYTFHNSDSYWAFNSASGNHGFLQVYEGQPPVAGSVPVPATLWLVGLGFAGLGFVRSKKSTR